MTCSLGSNENPLWVSNPPVLVSSIGHSSWQCLSGTTGVQTAVEITPMAHKSNVEHHNSIDGHNNSNFPDIAESCRLCGNTTKGELVLSSILLES